MRYVPVPYLLALAVLALGAWTDDPMVINIVVILVAIGTLQLAVDFRRRRDESDGCSAERADPFDGR